MNKLLIVLFACGCMLAACGGKKKMSGKDSVDVNDFIEFFDEIKLPVTLADSVLKKKYSDSLLISDTILSQFAGDTIFHTSYGKEKPKLYAIGRFKNADQETYLLLKAKGSFNSIYVLAFTPEKKFSADMLLLSDGKKSNEVNKVVIDPRYTFNLVDEYKDADGTNNQFTQVYAYNNAGMFMMIMKDGLQKGEVKAIINPIDTLPGNNKYSGDYGKDKRNFITVRDGKTPGDFIFFINMDKDPDCQADLKGEAVFVTKDSAIYTSKSDPCTLGFKFGTKSIRITEQVVCGNKRPAGCSFNASYRLQRSTAVVKEKEKKKGKKK